MAHTITFDAEHKHIDVLVVAPVSEDDALDGFCEIRTHRRFRTDYGICINCRADDLPLSAAKAMRLGEFAKQLFPGQRIALIRDDPPQTQVYEVLRAVASPSADVKTFKELKEAEAWLAS
jgi:hypothetical protein